MRLPLIAVTGSRTTRPRGLSLKRNSRINNGRG
jgi:hypothetical protein